jgi:hypothetical protein
VKEGIDFLSTGPRVISIRTSPYFRLVEVVIELGYHRHDVISIRTDLSSRPVKGLCRRCPSAGPQHFNPHRPRKAGEREGNDVQPGGQGISIHTGP